MLNLTTYALESPLTEKVLLPYKSFFRYGNIILYVCIQNGRQPLVKTTMNERDKLTHNTVLYFQQRTLTEFENESITLWLIYSFTALD